MLLGEGGHPEREGERGACASLTSTPAYAKVYSIRQRAPCN